MLPIPFRSQPTYKEWKRYYLNWSSQAINGSQPTYKEWKPFYPHEVELKVVWFPAYLQGMETISPGLR